MAFSLESLAPAVRERRVLAWMAGAAIWLGWLLSLARGGWTQDATGHRLGADHVEYYVVGKLVREGQAGKVYDLDTMKDRQAEVGGPDWPGVLVFRYPPFYALVFAPTSGLPYELSWGIWTVLGLAALLATGWLLDEAGWTWLGWSLCFYPVFAAVSFGQNSLLSLGILAGTLFLLRRQQILAAGLVAGLLLYKPQLLVGVGLLWLLEVRQRWPALLGLAITGLVLGALGWLLIPDACQQFLATLGQNVTAQDRKALPNNQSTQGFWMLLLPGLDRLAQGLSLACSLATLVGLFWISRRVEGEPRFAFAVAGTLLLSPYMMIYDWSILILPALILWQCWPERRDRWWVLFAAVGAAAFVSGPLVKGQLLFLPVALQISVPVLAAALALSVPRAEGRRANHRGTEDTEKTEEDMQRRG
jgi:hypothetical protein